MLAKRNKNGLVTEAIFVNHNQQLHVEGRPTSAGALD